MTKILSHGTPQRIVRDQQSYQLVAMIEGAAANTQFIQNLQVVGRQRQTIEELGRKLAALPATAPAAERESIESQLKPLNERLGQNLEFMAKHYGYSVQNNYMLVPVNAALLEKALDEQGKPVEDEAKATLVAEFLTSEAYDELQALRNRIVQLAADPAKKDEIATVQRELKEKFSFDVTGHYILQVRKGALYATTAA